MKKLLLIALVAFLAVPAMAQESGDIRVKGGLGYLFDASTMAFGGDVEYVFADAMSANVGFLSADGGSVIAIDYRYYFMTDATQVYANAGYTAFTGAGGPNVGVGAIFFVADQIGLEPAIKYELTKVGDQTVGLLGSFKVVYQF